MSTKGDLDESEINLDAIDRFETVLNHQVNQLESIDNKAERIMRIIALLFGLLVTGASIATRDGSQLPTITATVEWTFIIGLAGLSATIGAAVITYISSRMRFGLHYDTADTLEKRNLPIEQYSQLVVNAYASALEDNRDVLDTNNARFRRTLGLFVFGISFTLISITNLLLLGAEGNQRLFSIVGGLIVVIVSALIISGRLLTLSQQD